VSSGAGESDLVITDVWTDGGEICYQIRNSGDAVAPKGHYTTLFIDGEPRVNDLVEVELVPQERMKRCFNYGWQCSPPYDTIAVCADHKNEVSEANETNNWRNETWKCDTEAPVINTGPTVSEITLSSATISWNTSEESDSVVKFGDRAGTYEHQQSSLGLTKVHQIVLSDLKPSTTYHYAVQSTDASENTVVSRTEFFETSPLPDDKPPVVHALTISRGKTDFLYYEIAADVSDNIGLERVEFYLDDLLLGTAYSPEPDADNRIGADYSARYQWYLNPFSTGMTHAEFFADKHTIKALAVDNTLLMATPFYRFFDPPYECESIGMAMRQPHSDYSIYIDYREGDTVPAGTIVPVEVYAAVEQESCECTRWRYDPRGVTRCADFRCMTMLYPVSAVEFYVNHVPIPNSSSSGYIYTGYWDASGLGPGTYSIRVDARANEGCKQTIIRNVSVEAREPGLQVSREVTRIGSHFKVELSIENRGTASVQLDRIEDNVDGFQPIRTSAASEYRVTTDCTTDGKHCDIEIDLFSERLAPGTEITVEYEAVPVLYPDFGLAEYGIGDEAVSIMYDSGTLDFDRPGILTSDRTRLAHALGAALLESDYLIVTNPERLFDHYHDRAVDELLSAMASLAVAKSGVLGYLNTTSHSTVKNLIGPGGGWSRQLDPDWTSTGYLLIVGETEIVPSRNVYDRGIRNATLDYDWQVYPVPLSDNYYADICGNDNIPELIVGRLIGDSPAQVMRPIETSLLDQFDRTDAFVVSGFDSFDTAVTTSFERNADEIAAILDDEFTVEQMYVSDFAPPVTHAQRLENFTARAQDKDVIVYRDHGEINAWNFIIHEDDPPVDFGTSCPFAFCLACLTGNFEDADDNDYCIGEAFLDSNAGVYIGATEQSSRDVNNNAGKNFFESWVNSPLTIGQVLKETKRTLNTSKDKERMWILEYNLYGDPKYGASPAAAGLTTIPQSSQPVASLAVAVPDYVVKTIDGLDYVELPGGQAEMEEGKPLVPYYTVSRDYARGYRVQEVILTERSGLTTATGFNLPLVSLAPGGKAGIASGAFDDFAGSEWYPRGEYGWKIIQNPDGSTTVHIALFPFYYNRLTTDVRFYQKYTFEIAYTASPVEITHLNTDRDAYPPGDTVSIELWLNNPGETQDVIVDAVVRAEGSGELVDGLLLHTLKGLKGPASFALPWDSSGVAPGYYYVAVSLKDTSGNVLDQETELFRLGISSGEMVSLTATPEIFAGGDAIEIEMAFRNNGTVNISGTAIIKVLNSTGYATEVVRHNVTNVGPSESICFRDEWDTSGAEGGSYRILGYVLYESTATEPVTISIHAKMVDTVGASTLTPGGLIALVSLLAAIAAVAIVRKRR